MSSNKPPPVTITLPLKEFCHLCLGRGYWHERPLPKHIATVILALTQNKPESGYYIQTDTGPDKPLTEPILWEYGKWVEEAERWKRQKEYSHKRRVERFIEEANIKKIAVKVRSVLLIEGDASLIAARQILHKHNMGFIKGYLGIDKLITKEEEL